MINLGPFRLVDPPPGQAEIVAAAFAAIDYPWDRLTPELSNDPDGVCLVKWVPMRQGVTGLFYGSNYEIHLSEKHLTESAGFVFAHEVGHLVDRATLDAEARDYLMDLYHGSPETYREDVRGETFNGKWWPMAHANPHAEKWVNSIVDYKLRMNESYADLFVRAFAPSVWDGSYLEDAPSRGDTWVRFVHWTHDLQSVREISLMRNMHPAPPPAPSPTPEPAQPPEEEPVSGITVGKIKDVFVKKHPRYRYMVRAVNLGLLDLDKQNRFFPGRKVTRAQLAEALVRLHDKAN